MDVLAIEKVAAVKLQWLTEGQNLTGCDCVCSFYWQAGATQHEQCQCWVDDGQIGLESDWLGGAAASLNCSGCYWNAISCWPSRKLKLKKNKTENLVLVHILWEKNLNGKWCNKENWRFVMHVLNGRIESLSSKYKNTMNLLKDIKMHSPFSCCQSNFTTLCYREI